MSIDFYAGKHCVVTGGASFIGSHLVEALVIAGSNVIVVDDFSSGRLENLDSVLPSGQVTIVKADLSDRDAARSSIPNADVLFHLAAIHGGRGYIEAFPEAMLVNLAIDNNVLSASANSEIGMVVQASSACAYPVGLQEDALSRAELDEGSAGFDDPLKSYPDGTYGWIKLMGEYQLAVTSEAGRFRGRSARIFTAYGERENESHAVVALIAKASLGMDPYPLWGTGMQTRNFTYVSDTVMGLLLLGSDSRELRFDVFNIGTSTHHTILDLLEVIFNACGWRPNEIDHQLDKPMGVASRAASNQKMIDTFGWKAEVPLAEGIAKTVAWYLSSPDLCMSVQQLEARLLSR